MCCHADKPQSIVILANSGQQPMKLTLGVAWVSEERDAEGSRRLMPQQEINLFGEGEGNPALVVEAGGGKHFLTLDYFRRYAFRPRSFRADLRDEPGLPCVFVSPYGGERTATLGSCGTRSPSPIVKRTWLRRCKSLIQKFPLSRW